MKHTNLKIVARKQSHDKQLAIEIEQRRIENTGHLAIANSQPLDLENNMKYCTLL